MQAMQGDWLPARESVVQIARGDVGKGTAGTEPAGIVHHVARCGSTLVSQLLKQHVGTVVHAEPLPADEILLPPYKWSRPEIVAALRSLGAAFAGHARRPWVLKVTSWNTLLCDVVAEAFPGTPWVLCLRDPVEVCVSLLELPAGWIWDGTDQVAPHLGLALGEPPRRRMRESSGTYSKSPVGRATAYSGDSERKRASATVALLAAIDAHARPARGAMRASRRGPA
jgi:hypothetical protein